MPLVLVEYVHCNFSCARALRRPVSPYVVDHPDAYLATDPSHRYLRFVSRRRVIYRIFDPKYTNRLMLATRPVGEIGSLGSQ